MTRLNVEEFVANTSQASAFNLSMEMETRRQHTIGNENELSEEATALFQNIILDILVAGNAYHDIVVCHGTISKPAYICLYLFAIHHETAKIMVCL